MLTNAISDLNKQLQANLPWLNKAYGLAQIVKQDKELTYFPAIYENGREYQSLLPDDTRGNYSFFLLQDPQQVEPRRGNKTRLICNVSLIFWFNLETLQGLNSRDLEEVKDTVLDVLVERLKVDRYSCEVLKIWSTFSNVYKEFTIKEIRNQYLMHPYGALRFDLKLNVQQLC